jgi:hypothetical protein
LRVEVRLPGIEEPDSRIGPRPKDHIPAELTSIECAGTLEMIHELFLVFSPRAEILEATPSAVLRRLAAAKAGKARARTSPEANLADEARGLLSAHLVAKDGVTALRQLPGDEWISSAAGLALAVSLRRLFPRDRSIGETALRLADFSLKGQLPCGLLYDNFHLEECEWHGVRGRPAREVISIRQSARIAELMLMLADDLAAQGLPFEKYFLAGQRFVDLFVDERGKCSLPSELHSPAGHRTSREEDMAAWALLFPIGRVLDRLGRDRYKKALSAIAARFAGARWDIFHPPSSRAGRDSDSSASLLVVRTFLELRRRGFRPAEPAASAASAKVKSGQSARLFASLLLPWIRIHGHLGDGMTGLDGTLVDSFVRQRLLFAGRETAYLLGQLAELAGPRGLKSLLLDVARLCLAGATGSAPGTAFFQHTRWDQDGREAGAGKAGPVDSRALASEILYGLLAAPPGATRTSGRSARDGRSRTPSGKP